MNKTVSVNISGFIFNIEETAYEKLSRYLNTIRGYFSESTGSEEIIEDIEGRIAELFQEKINDNYQVIKLKDVNEVIAIMGEPEEYLDGEIDIEIVEESTYSKNERKSKYRKIYRDPDDKVLGGVCSGIGYYFGIDPIWIRLLFIILLVGFGTGILLYIILWIIIPQANTASEKLEMKGDPVTAENIGKQVEEEISNIKKKFNKKKDSGDRKDSKQSNGLSNFFSFLGKLLHLLLNSLGKIFGFIFILIGLAVLVALAFSIGTSGDYIGNFADINGVQIGYPEFVALFPDASLNSGWIGFFTILTIGIPFLGLVILGFNMLTNFTYKIKGLGLAMFLVWFIAAIGSVFYAGNIVKNYVSEYEEKSTFLLEQITGDTITIDVMQDELYSGNHTYKYNDLDFMEIIYLDGGRIYIGNTELDIQKSDTEEFQLIIYKESRGRNRADARENLQRLEYDFMELGNLISFAPYFSIPEEQGYHFEELHMRLLVPEGKAVYLKEGSEGIIYDIENVTNTWDLDMIGKVWTMTNRGLECIDCDPENL